MNYGGISLDAYAKQGSGFGEASMGSVDELNKALEASHSRGSDNEGVATAGDGAPLKVESLEKTLKVVTFSEKNIVFWKDCPVLPAYNTVEEFNKLTSYGSDQGGFNNEGELPQEDDSTYVRESELVKYLGNTRVITHPMTLVNSAHGAVMEREIKNGTIWILQKLERALFEGNSDIVPQEFNGMYKQHQNDFSTEIGYLDSENVIDARGMRVSEAMLEEASNVIIENFGFPTDIYWSPRVGSDFAKNFYPRQRTITPVGADGKVGSRITGFVSQAGEIPFHPDIFMKPKSSKAFNAVATSPKAPAGVVPDESAAVAAIAATAANTKFESADAGDYFYAIGAINRYGESALVRLNASAAVTVVENGAVDLKFVEGGGTYPATGYRIYRTLKGAAANTTYYPLFEISAAQLVAGYLSGTAGEVRDLNRYLPNTGSALMMQKDLEVFSFKQLAPLMKMDLALLGPAYRFMVLLYGTPLMYAPRKIARIINIGQTADATTNALIA